MSVYYNANLPQLSELKEKCKTRQTIVKFIVKDSRDMSLQRSNQRAIDEGKIMSECHYFISKKGNVLAVRPEEYYTEYGDTLFNKYSIIIELEGEFTWENISQLQYNALINLVYYLDSKYKTYNKLELLSEYIDEENPGPNFPIDEINTSIDNRHRYGLGSTDVSVLDSPIKENIMLTSPYTCSKNVLILKYKMLKAGVSKVVINDVYDEETARLVSTIKYLNGISPDYTCTPEVVRILDDIIDRDTKESKYIKNPNYRRLLYLKNPYIKGKDVLAIQEKLYSIDIYEGEFNEIYNEETCNAVKKFQSSRNIKVTGNVDVHTWKLIISIKQAEFTRLLFFDEVNPIEGKDVLAIQTRLRAMNYSIILNGIYNRETEEAIKEYQSNNNLEVTGVVNKITFNSIMGE